MFPQSDAEATSMQDLGATVQGRHLLEGGGNKFQVQVGHSYFGKGHCYNRLDYKRAGPSPRRLIEEIRDMATNNMGTFYTITIGKDG